MKTIFITSAIMCFTSLYSQEHFAGISTSKSSTLISGTMNPAEFANLADTYTLNIVSISTYMSNNKIGFNDLVGSDNFEGAIFSGSTPASFRLDIEALGPSFAYKTEKWAFAVTTAGKTKANIINLNNDLGNAIVNGIAPESVEVATTVVADYNQKVSATSWGELGFSAASELFNANGHKLNAGLTLKLLFPGSYARMNASDFSGTLAYNNNVVSLTDAYSEVSFAYSGGLADNFSRKRNFANYFGNGPSGLSADIGVNYSWDDNNDGKYRLTAGAALRNMGSMTFKDSNNESNNYIINVPDGEFLDLNQFKNENDIKVIEQKLIQSGFAQIVHENTDFKVKLPASLALYADVNVYANWYLTAYTQQKLNADYEVNQLAIQNVTTIIPRYSTDAFEVFLPLSSTEISGFAAGIGARYHGFYIGSGSFITAVLNNSDTHQADGYIGFRIGF
ncbi:hypothetical protein ACLI09_09420 [Flavobacterium sp. RHBU_24]|uniref:hypothetical protein n=1 Tax=Flavobacterium sp. RHBU_24 TaxID=3391185 RepID=UPI003984BE33